MAPRSQSGSENFQQVVKARRKTKRKDCKSSLPSSVCIRYRYPY
jgi:hypothetical protein